jgi:hypothetical protein
VVSVPVLSQESAEELIRTERNSQPSPKQHHILVATRHLAAATRDLLRREGVSWVEELTGMCRLSGPGLLVDLKIRDAVHKDAADSIRARLREKSGIVAETLLLTLGHNDIRLANLAKQANVSTALASRVLARIANLKLVETHGAGPNRYWRIANFSGILDLWATEEHKGMQATGLYVWSRSPQDLFRKLTSLSELKGRWALASTAAANLYAPTLTTFPDPTIWIDSRIPVREVASALGGEVADKGSNVNIWQSKNNLPFEKAISWKPESTTTKHGHSRIVDRLATPSLHRDHQQPRTICRSRTESPTKDHC